MMKTFLKASTLLRVPTLFGILSLACVPQAQAQCLCIINNQNEIVCGRPIISVEAALAERNYALVKLEVAQAEWRTANLELQRASESLSRITALFNQGALSRQEVDNAQIDRDHAKVALAEANQKIKAAQANLEFAEAALRQAQENNKRE